MNSNFIVTKKNIVDTVKFLKNNGFSPLKDVVASDEEEQIVVTDTENKTYWLISNSTLDVTVAMIQSINGVQPEVIN